MCRRLAKTPGVFVLLVSLPAAAVELGKLSIDGFGSWAYGASNNANNFSVAQHTGQFSSGDFALALTARLSDRAVTGGQVRVLPREQMVYIDWLLGEWRFSDQARLRFGIVKHPFGIFGEVPRVGTLRPFYTLTESIYGPTEFTAAGVRGLSLSGSFPSNSGWNFSYDLYGGSIELRITNVADKVINAQNLRPGGKLSTTSEINNYILGGRLIANTPIDGLELRFSTYGTPVNQDSGPRFILGPSIQYLLDRFSARAEYFYLYEDGHDATEQHRAQAVYLELAYFLTERIQVATRADFYEMKLFNQTTSSLFDHHELAGTINYWFNPGLVVKLSVHRIDGNRIARPTAIDDALLAVGLDRHTTAVILGSQFSF